MTLRRSAGRQPTRDQCYQERLQREYANMQTLAGDAPLISYVTSGEDFPPRRYRIEIHNPAPTAITRGGMPVLAPLFRLRITLPYDYPEVPPLIQTVEDAAIPFHPHFTYPRILRLVLATPSEWRDYRRPYDPNEPLSEVVRRVAHSLQYRPEYIDEKAPRIANREALEWYLNQRRAEPTLFPFAQRRNEVPPSPHRAPGHPQAQLQQEPPPEPSVPSAEHRTFELIPQTPRPAPQERPAQRKRFEITTTSEPYKIAERPVSGRIVRDLSSLIRGDTDPSFALFFEGGAHEDLTRHIAWGRSTEANSVEQGGVLMGRVFTDRSRALTYGVVYSVIPAELAQGSGGYLLMGHEAWKAMIDRADEIVDARSAEKLQMIGWYHTHPNELSVFLSSTDLATQRRMFGNDWHFAVVLNPQRRVWRVFHGKAAIECPGHVLHHAEEPQRNHRG
jgi:proteasome lid subunit RPN8/RPN11/ubiquitin-protein ligase